MTTTHNHQHCMEKALDCAEKICADRGTRLTPLRRRVLEMIWRDHQAVKAYDLIENLEKGAQTKPPTVYRALDFLLDMGLIHKIESLNAYVGCGVPDDGDACHFLICDRCHEVTELPSNSLIRVIKSEARDQGFSIASQTIEVRGVCSGCQQ